MSGVVSRTSGWNRSFEWKIRLTYGGSGIDGKKDVGVRSRVTLNSMEQFVLPQQAMDHQWLSGYFATQENTVKALVLKNQSH